MKRSQFPARVERALDLPCGVLQTLPRIELSGNRRVVIEGCQGILTYDEDTVCLRTDIGVLRLLGTRLRLCRLSPTCTAVAGTVLSIEFL